MLETIRHYVYTSSHCLCGRPLKDVVTPLPAGARETMPIHVDTLERQMKSKGHTHTNRRFEAARGEITIAVNHYNSRGGSA